MQGDVEMPEPAAIAEDEVEEPAIAEDKEEEPAIAEPVMGRSVVILPLQQAPQATVFPAAPKPENKPKRIQHSAPMIAQFRPVNAAVPDASKAKADKGVFRTAAELVRNFHRVTPDRFHSKPANHSKIVGLQVILFIVRALL